jgi:molybdopterin-guanine dinucleotide biosynthesis adapter protein
MFSFHERAWESIWALHGKFGITMLLKLSKFLQMKIFGFSGWSGSGKTTLIEAVIPMLTAQGLKISVIKHAHHNVDIDKPGKDSYRFRVAGASEVMLAGAERWALMRELREEPEPELEELVRHVSPCDLVLVEGYKSAGLPKIEVHRPSLGKPFLFPEYQDVVAIASDATLAVELPVLNINDPLEIAGFVLQHTGLA